MDPKLNLKQLEKNTAAAIFQTGIVDIGIGLIMIIGSLAMLFDDATRYYIDILFIVPVLFIFLAVRYIASPRMGVVKFSRKRVKRNLWFMVTVTLFLVIMIILQLTSKGAVGEDPAVLGQISGRWIVSGIIFFIFTASAYFLDFRRMYFYAFLVTGAFNLSEVAREHPGILSEGAYAYLYASSVFLIVGCICLISFLAKYRIPDSKTYDK